MVAISTLRSLIFESNFNAAISKSVNG